MGYTVSFYAPNREARAKLEKFYAEHCRRWSQVARQEHDYTSGLLPGKELSYGPRKKNYYGFDYGAPDIFEREYVHCLARFFALRVGHRIRLSDEHPMRPYYKYDHETSYFEVQAPGVPAEKGVEYITTAGYDPVYLDKLASWPGEEESNKEALLAEMQRLDTLWPYRREGQQ